MAKKTSLTEHETLIIVKTKVDDKSLFVKIHLHEIYTQIGYDEKNKTYALVFGILFNPRICSLIVLYTTVNGLMHFILMQWNLPS